MWKALTAIETAGTAFANPVMERDIPSRIGTMRLSKTSTASAAPAGAPTRGQGYAQEPGGATAGQHAAESRALVVVEPAAASADESATTYRPAAFLAHLIAMKDLHPQTRARRRAAPGEAIAAYRATEQLVK